MKHIEIVPGGYFKRWGRLYHIEKVTSKTVLVEECLSETKTELDLVVLLEDDVERVYPVAVSESKSRKTAKVTKMVRA